MSIVAGASIVVPIIVASMLAGGLGAWWYATNSYSFGEMFLKAAYGSPKLPESIKEKASTREAQGVAASMIGWLVLFVALERLAAVFIPREPLAMKVAACTTIVAVTQANWYCHGFFENRSHLLFFIHAGYHVAGAALGSVVLFALKPAIAGLLGE